MAEIAKKRKFKIKHYVNYFVVIVCAVVFGILANMNALKSAEIYLIEKITISVLLAVSLSMVVGFLGELSLGHAGFMCVGAFVGGKISAILVEQIGDENSILALVISLIVGGLAAAACGVVIGLPALRLKGDYLAIVTLAFGEIVRVLFLNSSEETFGGTLGLATPRFDKKVLFIIIFVMVFVCLWVVQNIIRSKHGRAITAIRDNEIAAKATGINITKYKLSVFTISALFAGIAGVFYSYSNFTIQSANFDYNYSIEILVMVVLGGMGSINGSIIAATVITFINYKLGTQLDGDVAVFKDLIYALILIVLVIYNNAPALKGVREKLSFKNLFSKKPDPATVHDDEAKWDRVPTKIDMDEMLSTGVTSIKPAKAEEKTEEEE